MKGDIRFTLNGDSVEPNDASGKVLLDYLRADKRLTGTKEGCREGDCGACMVLLGERRASSVRYSAAASCLLALGELEGCHVLTIEGLSEKGLNPVHKALLEYGASQCGFCSPGIVVSLTAFLLDAERIDAESAERAVEGNLCRCTGYGSIRRACEALAGQFSSLPKEFPRRVEALESAGVIPPSVRAFMEEGRAAANCPKPGPLPFKTGELAIGGGTDYFVRYPYGPSGETELAFLGKLDSLRGIALKEGRIEIGAAETIETFFRSELVSALVPNIGEFEFLFASSPIRGRATIGGNIANASPAADMSAVLIALGAAVRLSGKAGERTIPLENFFLGYKKTALGEGERLCAIILPASASPRLFNFEKASKRMHLDIASVNTAMAVSLEDGIIEGARISAGGVAPIPLLLKMTSEFIVGKKLDSDTARVAAELALSEISPIDDLRGSADYRRSLVFRLILAHFLAFSPNITVPGELAL